MSGVLVKLYDDDRGIDADDFMGKNLVFSLIGTFTDKPCKS